MTHRLDNIYQKIKLLVDRNKILLEENVQLKKAIKILQERENELLENQSSFAREKENLENKLSFHTLAANSLNKKELKEKIDQYISEIDLCIKQLENL